MAIKINDTTVIDNSRNLTSIEAATFTGTGYVKVPSGTDAQRPVSPSNGMFRYNTTSNTFEGYVSGAWVENLHTGNIAPTHIPEDATHRWTTDAEKTNWNSKAAGTHNHTLDGLSNTTITSNTSGEILKWNGSAWVNNTLAEAGISETTHNHTLDSLSDTTITSNAAGEILKWSGTKWINNTLAEAGIAAATHTHSNYDEVPPGTVIFFAGATLPSGYLKANGATVSRTTYASLYSAIGTRYGAGDGSTTFKLPDLRGEFVRGWDDSRGVDSGRVLGTWQEDMLKSHRHQLNIFRNNTNGGGFAEDANSTGTQYQNYTEYEGGAETRPRNIALMACIKY